MDKKDTTAQVNTLNNDELAEINSQGKRKTPRSLKKLAWWAVLVVPVLVVATYLVVMFVRNKDVYARVGDGVVTKAEYKSARALNEKVAKLTNNETVLKDIDGYTNNQLFAEASLKAEAKKYNVTITDNDIEEQILSTNSADAKKMDTPADTIKNFQINTIVTFGSDLKIDDIMRPYRIKALKNKLANNILDYRSILLISTRWDFYGGTTKYNKDQADQLAKQTLATVGMALMREKKSDDDIVKLNRPFNSGLSSFSPATLVVSKMEYLNQKNDPSTFQDQKDWDGVNSLDKVGDYTPVTKSEGGGYYYIMRLSEHGTGSFKTWDDYEKTARAKAVIFGTGFNWRSLIAYNQSGRQFAINNKTDGLMCMEQKQPNFMTRVFGGFGLNDKAMAEEIGACPVVTTTSQHLTKYSGKVYNSALQLMANATVRLEPAGQICPIGQPNITSPVTVKTNGAGYWETPFNLSCWMPWKIVISAKDSNGQQCTFESYLVKPEGTNGHAAPPQDVTFNCIGTPGRITIEHWIKPINNSGFANDANGYHIGQVPQTQVNGVNTCLTNTERTNMANNLSCNFNDPTGSFNFPIFRGEYGLRVAGPDSVQSAPLLAPNWVPDHIEVTYDCGGGLSGPWRYPEQVSTIAVVPGCGFTATGTTVRSYFRQVSPPTVKLTMDGLPLNPGDKGSSPNNPIEKISDSQAGATLEWTTGGDASNGCFASNDYDQGPNGWYGARAPGVPPSTREDRAQNDSQTDNRLVHYVIICGNSAGNSPESSVWVRYRRQYYPYIKTRNGDVSVTERITVSEGSGAGKKQPGSFATSDALAEYVVSSAGSNYFCSVNKMLFGTTNAGDQDYSCKAGAYSVKNNPPGSVLSSLQKYAGSNTNSTCDPADKEKPYSVEKRTENTLTVPTAPNDFAETMKDCPKVWKYPDGLTINSLTISRGRATIWVDGTVNIAGDISNGPMSGGKNTLPNVAIIAKKINIAPNVNKIQASLYAYSVNGDNTTGRINTCTSYPDPACQQPLNIWGRVGAEAGYTLGRNGFDPSLITPGPLAGDGSGSVPAEFIHGTAQSLIFPPPGFEDIISEDATAVKYNQGELNPRF